MIDFQVRVIWCWRLIKKKFGNKIRLDSGKDLCQASLDGKLIDGESYNSKIPFNNYDFLKKLKMW